MGKSIDDVSMSLRIAHRYLQGIEEGNFEGWPEKVFSLGFIRSYAKYLSMDPAPVIEEYEKGQEKYSPQEEAVMRPEWMDQGRRKTSYIIMTVVVLLVGVMLAFFTMRRAEELATPLQATKVDNVAPVVPPEIKEAAPAPQATAVADNVVKTSNVVTASNDATANKAATANKVSQADNVVTPAPKAAPPVTSSAASGTGPFQLFLEASDHTWLMYSFDGGEPIDVTLHMGDKISIQAAKSITLKIGNASGVTGTLNGQRLPPFGKSGQVRNITFGQ
jgi:cytoskeleton protein RodZ